MNAKHAGKFESWIESRAMSRRGYGQRPKRARPGRHAAMPTRQVGARMMRSRGPLDIYGWRAESLALVARMVP